MTRYQKLRVALLGIPVGLLFLPACGTVRDSSGVVHDKQYIGYQANDISHDDPLAWTYIPFAIPWNAAKALPENGRVELAGTVVDEQGHPLDGLKMTIRHARLLTYDIENNQAVFNELQGEKSIDSAFRVSYFSDHMITLKFEKDGYAPASCHVELVEHAGDVPADKASHADQNFYGESPLRETNVVVVMKRAGTTTRPGEQGG